MDKILPILITYQLFSFSSLALAVDIKNPTAGKNTGTSVIEETRVAYDREYEKRENKNCEVSFVDNHVAIGGFGESEKRYWMIRNIIAETAYVPSGVYIKHESSNFDFPKPPVPPTPNPEWEGAVWLPSLYGEEMLVRADNDIWGTINWQYRELHQGSNRRLGADTIFHWDGGKNVTYFRLPENKADGYDKQIGIIKALAGQGETLLAVGYERGDILDSVKATAKIWRFDGKNWNTENIPNIQGQLTKVAILSSTDAWAAGGDQNGIPVLLHFDGKSWNEFASPMPADPIDGKIWAFGRTSSLTPAKAWNVLVADGKGGLLLFASDLQDAGFINNNFFSGYTTLAYRWDGQRMYPISTPKYRDFFDRALTKEEWKLYAYGVTSQLWRTNAATLIKPGKVLVHVIKQMFGPAVKHEGDGAMYIYDVETDRWTLETLQAPTSLHGFHSLHTTTPGVASMAGVGQLWNLGRRGLYIYDCR